MHLFLIASYLSPCHMLPWIRPKRSNDLFSKLNASTRSRPPSPTTQTSRSCSRSETGTGMSSESEPLATGTRSKTISCDFDHTFTSSNKKLRTGLLASLLGASLLRLLLVTRALLVSRSYAPPVRIRRRSLFRLPRIVARHRRRRRPGLDRSRPGGGRAVDPRRCLERRMRLCRTSKLCQVDVLESLIKTLGMICGTLLASR